MSRNWSRSKSRVRNRDRDRKNQLVSNGLPGVIE